MKRSVKYSKSKGEASTLKDSVLAPSLENLSPMVRTQIYLSRAEYDFVQAQSSQHGQPMAAVIRSFIDEKMQLPDEAWTNNPMLRPTPKDPEFELPEDAAINHDHYLYGTPKKYIKVAGQWSLAKEAGKR